MIALLQWFNEAILMPTAVVLNVAARLVRPFTLDFVVALSRPEQASPCLPSYPVSLSPDCCWRCCGLARASSVDTG